METDLGLVSMLNAAIADQAQPRDADEQATAKRERFIWRADTHQPMGLATMQEEAELVGGGSGERAVSARCVYTTDMVIDHTTSAVDALRKALPVCYACGIRPR